MVRQVFRVCLFVLSRCCRVGTTSPLPPSFFYQPTWQYGLLAEAARVSAQAINGVPCFVFNARYALPGAQPPEVLLRMFETVNSELEQSDVQAGA